MAIRRVTIYFPARWLRLRPSARCEIRRRECYDDYVREFTDNDETAAIADTERLVSQNFVSGQCLGQC